MNFLCSVSSDFWLESLTCWHAGPCASVEAKLVLHVGLPLLYSLPKNTLKRLKTSANFPYTNQENKQCQSAVRGRQKLPIALSKIVDFGERKKTAISQDWRQKKDYIKLKQY